MTTLALGAACSSFSGDEPAAEPGLDGGGAEGAVPDVDAAPGPDGSSAESSTPPVDALVLASGYSDLTSVAASETTVYFVARTEGVIHAVPLDGTGTIADFYKDSPLTSPNSAVLYDNELYFGDFGKATLGRKNVGGGPSVVMDVANAARPAAIAVSTGVSGVRLLVVATTNGTGTIQQYDTDLGFVLQSTGTFQTPFDIAVHGKQVWWTESSAGTIWEGALDDAASTSRASGESGCESIAADGQGVYWTRLQDGLVRMMVPPQTTVQTLAKNQVLPISIASDASGVYWLTGDGKVQRSNRQPSELPPQTIAKNFAGTFSDTHVSAIALTSKYVVWITGDGKVLRHDK